LHTKQQLTFELGYILVAYQAATNIWT